jgi:5-methyltetrahydropteroyltriglutamate--homocysteine methyltransferase
VERLRLVRNVPLEEFRFVQRLTDRPAKVTFIGPDRISQRFAWEESASVYPGGLDEFVTDLVQVQRRIVSELVEAGCKYVQIDAPSYTAYVDQPSLEQMRSRGEDPARNLARSIEADNAVIEGFPGVTFGIHLCRGNQRSMWHREGSYDAIAEQLFGGLKHQRLLLEYDDERSGSFEPLRFVPSGKTVVLGLITTKTPRVETAQALKARIEEATRFLPLEQLALSPQCGFASDLQGNLITEGDQWRKLEVMLETARAVWR